MRVVLPVDEGRGIVNNALGLGSTWDTVFGVSRVVFGANTLDRLGELTRGLGCQRALLVTDRGIREAGHVDRALAALREASVETAVYDAVSENPTSRHVVEGAEVAAQHAADCIVALGGGSPMDCAKGINFVFTNGGRIEDYWGAGKAGKPMLPTVGIPTTAGTGSEAQSYALICRDGDGTKMACGDKKAMFRVVILDPLLASTAPPEVVAVSGIDAVSHAVESYVSTRRNPLSQMFAREAWRLLDGALPGVVADVVDPDPWGSLLLGAFLAGAAIEHSMLGAAHACANPVTARFPVPHGSAVGIMLPHVIRFNAAVVGQLYDELCTTIEHPAPRMLEQRVSELKALLALPTSLREYQIPHDCLGEMAADAERQWTAGFNPRPVTARELLELYEQAY